MSSLLADWVQPAPSEFLWLDEQGVPRNPELDDLRHHATAWVMGMRKVMNSRPKVRAVPAHIFATAIGCSRSPAYPPLFYTQRLAQSVWAEAVLHLRAIAPWTNYFDLPEGLETLVPRLTLRAAVCWCRNTARLVETCIAWFRPWLPNAGDGSAELDAVSLRSVQTCLLSIMQALALLDPDAQALDAITRVKSLQQCEHLLADEKSALMCISEVRLLLRHIWAYQLALEAGSKRRFEVVYWCATQLDQAKLLQRVYHTGTPEFSTIYARMTTLIAERSLQPLRYPAKEPTPLMQSYASEYFLTLGPNNVIDRPVPLRHEETQETVGRLLPEPID
jgi:hypothetical protein